MRLIDSKLLLEELGEEPYIWTCTDTEIQEHSDWLRFKEMIERQPTADAVEVPCKIGQTVYVINGLWVSNYVVTHFWYDGCFFKFKAINEEYAYECRDFSFFDERIGKTVFFTNEQAEMALAKMDGERKDNEKETT